MKKIAFALSFFLLVLLVPVYGCVILIGNRMPYNAEHKIETLYSNPVLLFFVFLMILIVGGAFYALNKIPSGKYVVAGTVCFSAVICMLFYIVKVEVSKCIAFYGGWDCGMVANSARWVYEGKDLGYEDYYYVFTNNVPITWLLHILYRFSNSIASYAYNPEFIWIQFQCLMFAMAVFFSAMTVLLISRKVSSAILSLFFGILVLGLCPWQIIPYTDASTIAFGIFVVFLYSCFRRIISKWKYAIWFLMSFAGIVGGIMKATCYVALIAVILTEYVWLIFDEKGKAEKIRELAFRTVLLVCGFILAAWCKSGMYQTINYVPDHDMEMTWSNLLYDGLNEETTGACSSGGLDIARQYAGYPANVRRSVELQYVKGRIQEKGFKGLIYFWLRKQVMNFNDGTFSWYQEGWFNAWEYPDITDSRWKGPLRNFYWEDGEDYLKFTTMSQGIWIFIIMGILIEAIFVAVLSVRSGLDQETLCMRTVNVVFFIGLFFFVLLFEGRARYLLNNVPILITMSALGYSELYHFLGRFKRLRR